MLRAKALTPLLAQLNGAGVKASMLLAPDGRLLCYTSVPDFVETDRLIGSVAAHAFSEYRGACRAGFEPPAEADFLSVELEASFRAVLACRCMPLVNLMLFTDRLACFFIIWPCREAPLLFCL